jgi:hypothetical protein
VRRVGEAGFLHESNTEATGPTGPKFNQLPPGMEINNQLRDRIHAMPLSVAGESDVSADTNEHSFKHGYTRRDMKGADDLYSGEHVDHFYGEVVDENGKAGFAERNNYLDRYRVTDVGEPTGILMISDGSRWKPLAGRTRLKTLVSPVSGRHDRSGTKWARYEAEQNGVAPGPQALQLLNSTAAGC